MDRLRTLALAAALSTLPVACAPAGLSPAAPDSVGGTPTVGASAAPAPAPTLLWTPAPDAPARAASIGMGEMDMGPGAPHLHVHLDVFRDGVPVVVPGAIGAAPGFMAALHTHGNRGVIHVEGGVGSAPTLGQLFTLWGVSLEGAQVYVGGAPSRETERLVLTDLMQIAVVFGSPPATIPSSYAGPWE